MSVMALLGEAVRLVDRGQVDRAVALVLDARVPDPDDFADTMLRIACWPDSSSFEDHEADVLMGGRWGRFWLCPSVPRRTLMPPAPVIVPRHLRALADAMIATAKETPC